MCTQMCGLLWRCSGKESTCNAGAAGDMNLIPGSGRSPGGGHGNPFQYAFLENSIDSSWGCKESDMTEMTQHAFH